MKAEDIDDAFFTGKAMLLVEDALSRRVLKAIFRMVPAGKDVVVRSVGGREAIRGLVAAARSLGRGNVFGLADRDFSDSVSSSSFGAQWTESGRVETECHEIENYLLDYDVLASLQPRDAGTVEQRVERLRAAVAAHAKALVGWMAVRRVLVAVKRDLFRAPADPAPTAIADVQAATRWFADQGFPKGVDAMLRAKWTASHVASEVEAEYLRCEAQLARGEWATTFSGKELFAFARGQGSWRYPFRSDDDLAAAVAEQWERGKGTVPPFFVSLRDRVIADAKL